MRYRVIQFCVALTVIGALTLAAGAPHEESVVHFDDQGRLIRPTGYRTWVYIGTPLTPNDMNPPEAPFPDFHNVYIDPVSYDHYMKTGTFREGTAIIKELVGVGSNTYLKTATNAALRGETIPLPHQLA